MATKSSPKRKLTSPLKPPAEGLLYVSFVFDGQVYRKQHQFDAAEIELMKQHVLDHGDQAADTALFRSAIWYAGRAAENLIAKAALEYMKLHKIPLVSETADVDSEKALEEAIAKQMGKGKQS